MQAARLQALTSLHCIYRSDCVQCKFIFLGLQEHPGLRIKFLYHDPKGKIQRVVSNRVSISVHQGGTILPLLFAPVMNILMRDTYRPAPYILLYADDVFLAYHSETDLEQLDQKWNDRFMQQGLGLNLNKTESLTTDSNGTDAIIVRTEQFIYLG